MDRGAAALGFGHHLDDARKQRIGPHLLRVHDEGAGPVDGSGDHFRSGVLGDGHGFAGDQRFVDRHPSLGDLAVDRDLFAGAHPQPIADPDEVERDLLVSAVLPDAPGRLGRQVQQRLQGSARVFASPQLQHLAEQHQDGDDGRSFKIDRRCARAVAERRREEARGQDGDQAVEPGDADAHGDKGEHVELARHQRRPAALEKRPAGPERHRGCEDQLYPVGGLGSHDLHQAAHMSAHLQDEHRDGEGQTDPEPAAHMRQLGIGSAVGGHRGRLQRHPADRADARPDLPDLRMHGTGVDGAGRRLRTCVLPGLQMTERVSFELGPAGSRTEEIGPACVLRMVGRRRRIDAHPTHRIEGLYALPLRGCAVMMLASGHGGLRLAIDRYPYMVLNDTPYRYEKQPREAAP